MHATKLTQPSEDTNNKSKYLRPASAPDETDVSRSAGRVHEIDYTAMTKRPGHRGLYAIIDTLTNTIVGGIQLHINFASAIRTLNDIAASETSVNKHPLDYELRLLGSISEDHDITPSGEIIITGDQIATMVENAKNGAQR